MVWIWQDVIVTVCKPVPTIPTAADRLSEILRLDDEHGNLMSALLARVGGTAASNHLVTSLTIVLPRPFGNGCSRWLIRRNILQP